MFFIKNRQDSLVLSKLPNFKVIHSERFQEGATNLLSQEEITKKQRDEMALALADHLCRTRLQHALNRMATVNQSQIIEVITSLYFHEPDKEKVGICRDFKTGEIILTHGPELVGGNSYPL